MLPAQSHGADKWWSRDFTPRLSSKGKPSGALHIELCTARRWPYVAPPPTAAMCSEASERPRPPQRHAQGFTRVPSTSAYLLTQSPSQHLRRATSASTATPKPLNNTWHLQGNLNSSFTLLSRYSFTCSLARNSLWGLLKIKFLGPTEDLVNKDLWRWGPAIRFLNVPTHPHQNC